MYVMFLFWITQLSFGTRILRNLRMCKCMNREQTSKNTDTRYKESMMEVNSVQQIADKHTIINTDMYKINT